MKTIVDDWIRILSLISVWKLILLFVTIGAIWIIPLQHSVTAARNRLYPDFGHYLPYALSSWEKFDSFHYLVISKDGYDPTVLPFFPLYPLLIRAAHAVSQAPRILLGQALSLYFFAAGLFVALRLFRLDHKPETPQIYVFLGIILTFPSAFYYAAIYPDSLYFLLATLTLYLARKELWVSAAIAAAIAVFARQNAVALLLFLLIEFFSSRSAKRRFLPLLYFLLVPAALGLYLLYIQLTFGDWSLLFSAMSNWNQNQLVAPPQVVFRYLKIFFTSFEPQTFVFWIAVLEFVTVIFYSYLILVSWKRIRLSYLMFFAVSLLIPALTGTFAGMPRYGLHLFPMYIMIFRITNDASVQKKLLYFSICAILQIVLVALFTRGVFVS